MSDQHFPHQCPEPEAGNRHLTRVLRRAGKVGHFFSREQIARSPTPILLRASVLRDAILPVIKTAIRRQLPPNMSQSLDVDRHAAHLCYGVCVMIYLKLRSVHSLDSERMMKYATKPEVPNNFRVLAPYALAISQLGMLNVTSLTREVRLTPDVDAADAGSYLLPSGATWCPAAYGQACEFAEKIGLLLGPVDLSQKIGSSWWVYKVRVEEDIMTLQCPIPEDNFSVESALVRSLFLRTDGSEGDNWIFEVESFSLDDYGSMLRNPPEDIAITTFFAVEWNE
ncbi:unnamed protein product [Linum trigynum]|uniref:Uncharacterized protein n=1 Tax=Linum trigynum TaxID=586398 RepID=A0AAV2FCP1_9ROSI